MGREKKYSIFFSLTPILYLVVSILFFRYVWIVSYPHPLALCLAGCLAYLQRLHHKFVFLHSAFRKNLLSVFPAMEILFLVGLLIASWAYSGVLLTMMQIGTILIEPKLFLPSVAIVSAIASMVSGSSWTTAGTLGVALMGVSKIWGFSDVMAAGAIVSGCYFGDKLSPLSDTTNLASSLTHVPIWTHIRYMLKTTCMSFFLAVFCFYLLNLFVWDPSREIVLPTEIGMSQLLQNKIIFWKLIPVFLVFGSSMFHLPVRVSFLLGIVSAFLFPILVSGVSFEMFRSLVWGYKSQTGNLTWDQFLSGGGIVSILPTEILIVSAVWFGAVVEGYGYLNEILLQIKRWVKDQYDILLSTMGVSFLLNLMTADQYLSLVIPARAFRTLAVEKQIPEKDISRALEDSGTITSPLIPWNSCGAFMASSLGVSVVSFLPFVFFNLIHVFLSVSILFYKKIKLKSS
ncbi:sodium:proton antiporter [Leptospira levettii]|uniref:Na+/H+ antiporter NhaC family protein n=1 Tax=Leptospira levettii TaxID=2023178 RepID=UPI000C29F775|nr:Na+/H+ antiporter NhaC family protein [Leptospira levettii]PKA27695.1 sodium:proton antiporter [Leptospira sp. mixed culture ATI2-C-A1]TGM70025.1 sodium:proton antiporter [Leptospira levettii]